MSRGAFLSLSRGLAAEPDQRIALRELDPVLSGLLGELVPPLAPPARFWTEDQVVRCRERDSQRSKLRLVTPRGDKFMEPSA